jgi:glycerophosphoryl diester phosphodiesterase
MVERQSPAPSPISSAYPLSPIPYPLRVAHGHGNRRELIERAIAAGGDLIETDLHYQEGIVWARHDHRAGPLPLLASWRPRGIHRAGPAALALGPLFLRLDRRPLRLAEGLARTSGRAGLLLDLKTGRRHRPGEDNRFVEAVLSDLTAARFAGRVEFSGSWPLLDRLRARAPGYYSVGNEGDWRRLLPRLGGPDAIPAISLRRRLLTPERAAVLRHAGIAVYCWDVTDLDEAAAALAHGASGIIADDLALLRALAAPRHE